MNEEKEATKEKTPEAAVPQKKEEGKKEALPQQKGEKPKNCVQCNKPIKRKSWYYRNGKYFCGKGCWKLSQRKAA